MDMFRKLEPLALFLMIVGALNWAILGLFDTNVLSEVLGTGTVLDVAYVVIGASALVFVPRLLDELHIGHRGGAHGAGV